MARLRRVVLERLIRYYRYLADLTARRAVDTITSAQLARVLDVDASQVRKDFAAVGLTGVSRVGYDVCEVCRTIRTALGFDDTYSAILVGTGHLGVALLNYDGFSRYGLHIVAAFDSDPGKVGQTQGDCPVFSVHELREFIEKHEIPVAILTTPGEVAQGLADLVTLAGVRAIWNFSPVRLTGPDHLLIRNEHISVGLAEISFHLSSERPASSAGNGAAGPRTRHPRNGEAPPPLPHCCSAGPSPATAPNRRSADASDADETSS